MPSCTTGSAAAPKARACEMSARRCRPAGQLLFLEHVRDEDPRIAKKRCNPAVPLLLDGVPSEPSHPGRDHRFEAVCRGRSPWCGPEGIRDRAADGARPSHAERRLMATGRNTHAMTFTRWLPGVDQRTKIIHRKLFPLQLDSRWFSSQVCFPLELGRGGRSGSGDSNGRHGSYMRFSDVEVRA